MNYFKSKCPACGKEVILPHPGKVGFCSRVCETNYKFEKNRMLKMS